MIAGEETPNATNVQYKVLQPSATPNFL